MELKRYQSQALERLSDWFKHLHENNRSPAAAWEMMDFDGEHPSHITRKDSSNRPIPHVCLKVPTGGGKTLLAAEALAKSNRRTGLVLWMVPSKAIYAQTKSAFSDKQHPYRQTLERASGGRVKILEWRPDRRDFFQTLDIENHLCVLLISLQSATRSKDPDFLKINQAGGFPSFFPDDDDMQAVNTLLDSCPGLKTVDGRIEKSLANVIKLCRPIIVLDEAHKAYGKKSSQLQSLVNQFDPSLVLELTATPDKAKSNILVDVQGYDLKEEEMIKLPVSVTGHSGSSWKQVLMKAIDNLDDLKEYASLHYENTGRYIRPMSVVRVQVTGKNQRGKGKVHADDVREFLTQTVGIPTDQVKIQSNEVKELEREDLMSEECRVRWVITKDALKEGWDCSFAYILVLLDSTTASTSVTQMVGRVLRQPYARLTNIQKLDRCYVHCGNIDVSNAVSRVKTMLEKEGFGDLLSYVQKSSGDPELNKSFLRPEFSEISQLPQVLHKDGQELDYVQHILADLDWGEITAPHNWGDFVDDAKAGTALVDIDEHGLRTSPGFHRDLSQSAEFDLAWYTRQLMDIVPNPWQAARIIQEAISGLGMDYNWLHKRRAAFLRAIEQHILSEVDRQAEQVFKRKLAAGDIKFDMEIPFEFREYYEFPTSGPGLAYQKTLFSPFFGYDMNRLEKRYAGYLDSEDNAISWWHRIAARQPGEYRLKGWKKDYVYPDFVALQLDNKIIIHETKGDHLMGNIDTDYKKRLLKCLQHNFNSSATMSIRSETMTADFRILFESDIS